MPDKEANQLPASGSSVRNMAGSHGNAAIRSFLDAYTVTLAYGLFTRACMIELSLASPQLYRGMAFGRAIYTAWRRRRALLHLEIISAGRLGVECTLSTARYLIDMFHLWRRHCIFCFRKRKLTFDSSSATFMLLFLNLEMSILSLRCQRFHPNLHKPCTSLAFLFLFLGMTM